MATQQEIEAHIARRLRRKQLEEIVFSDITAAFGGASEAEKDALVEAVRRSNIGGIERVFQRVIGAYINTQAAAEAAAIAADANIDFTELERIYGPF